MSENMVKGVGITIDDKIFDEDSDDLILEIVNKFNEEGIPLVKYDGIPSDDHINNFKYVSFILLDWELSKAKSTGAKKRQVDKNIDLLQRVKKSFFAPVFIFSHLDPESITDILADAGLYDKDNELNNFIFVKRKTDLTEENNLVEEINNWFTSHPSAYLLNSWGHSLQEAKNKTFLDLFEISAAWPKIIWENFENESVDEELNLSDLLFRQIKSRIPLQDFEKEIICNPKDQEIEEAEIRDVIAGAMYIKSRNLPDDDLVPGDIFQKDGKFFLNIRPACDTVIGRTYDNGQPTFDGYVYALRGSVMDEDAISKRYNKGINILIERSNEAIIYGIEKDEFVRFSLKKIKQIKLDDLREHRICRLLPPYITYIQNKYSSYLSRVGLPSYPSIVYPDA